ncbi:hypothetical protein O6H91_05G022300 [Diphasiastrum complanatum]|uniref:Uncharacterized protein n=1 Tax=Diphasiastrum complanatum TaxID=34168 RepID=A0ACC2DLH2_DIPCM|nr:hypothetical protein O6H91_05G022300 [Diphasiastrum complanatum]
MPPGLLARLPPPHFEWGRAGALASTRPLLCWRPQGHHISAMAQGQRVVQHHPYPCSIILEQILEQHIIPRLPSSIIPDSRAASFPDSRVASVRSIAEDGDPWEHHHKRGRVGANVPACPHSKWVRGSQARWHPSDHRALRRMARRKGGGVGGVSKEHAPSPLPSPLS